VKPPGIDQTVDFREARVGQEHESNTCYTLTGAAEWSAPLSHDKKEGQESWYLSVIISNSKVLWKMERDLEKCKNNSHEFDESTLVIAYHPDDVEAS
jgi:hypothetical protein